MRGYKALDENMCAAHGDKMQYELNKEYAINDSISIRSCGYHFCKEIINIIDYYCNIRNFRVFEIDTLDGAIDSDDDLYCSNKIKLIREVSKEELEKYFENYLDKFDKEMDWQKRLKIAAQGYCLDTLINSTNPWVRICAGIWIR